MRLSTLVKTDFLLAVISMYIVHVPKNVLRSSGSRSAFGLWLWQATCKRKEPQQVKREGTSDTSGGNWTLGQTLPLDA
jgi:hypothetical protein